MSNVMNNGTDNQKLKQTILQEALYSCKVMLRYILGFGFIINLLMLATPTYSMQVLDRVLGSGNRDTLVGLTLLVAFCIILLCFMQGARQLALVRMSMWFEKQLSHPIFATTVRNSVTIQRSAGAQNIRDLQTIKNFLINPGVILVLDLPWALIFIVALFIIHPYLGILTIVGGVILIVIGIIQQFITRPIYEKSNEVYIKSTRYVENTTSSAEVVHVMGFMSNIAKRWGSVNDALHTMHSVLKKKEAVITEISKFIRMFLSSLVTGIGAYLVLEGQITAGHIIASSAFVGRALGPFENAIKVYTSFLEVRKSYNRVQASLRFDKNAPEDRMHLPEPEGRLAVENAEYTIPSMHNNQKPIVSGVSFELETGTTMALVGPSASGKTTLARLIVGACKATKGVVRIDGSGLDDWNRDQLGPHIGYLPQDVELFSGTIKDNIARMKEDADADAVVKAAKLAGVHEMILRLHEGYNTKIGPGGVGLSGGQKQRIGLARAFYGDPKIIVLDEPNASLDRIGEISLHNSIISAKSNRVTTIIISHKTGILNLVDKIMVMKDGRIDIFGDKNDVIDKLYDVPKDMNELEEKMEDSKGDKV